MTDATMTEHSVEDQQESGGTIGLVNGPVVIARGLDHACMNEVVRVGHLGLIGEVISLKDGSATIQVYEETTGLQIGEPVICTGASLSVELGPGMLGNIYDGIQRPLPAIREVDGDYIRRGTVPPSLDRSRRWLFTPTLAEGERCSGGEIIGSVEESTFLHSIMLPPDCTGIIDSIVPAGEYSVDDVVARVRGDDGALQDIRLFHSWQIRKPRPVTRRLAPSLPLVTGQRVIDAFFPITKGGTASIPGGFGSGKTVTQHNLAKWCNADIIVFIGCGERGNEMTGVLTDFPELKDPIRGRPLIERTILIANTSNMPVAAREASIYTGISIAEYFRDMGYQVAIMADSTSRWAEALREISGRLEELPAEEGFPAYLASRLGEFYERASRVESLCGKEGAVSIIGAVSPPGGDFSEPVTMQTQRFTKCFWALDKDLAVARFFPSINPLQSYSDYRETIRDWWLETTNEDMYAMSSESMILLREDHSLQQIVRLIGEKALPDQQQALLLCGRILKEGYLQQSAYDEKDMHASPEKQALLLKTILFFCGQAREAVDSGIAAELISGLRVVSKLIRAKSEISNDECDQFTELLADIEETFRALKVKGGRGSDWGRG